MAKDPAFLFYSSDFLTGTMFMSDEQTGQYIRLLCAQHQKGRLTEKHMLNICKKYDEEVHSKFTIDEKGLYYNERLEDETIKRAKFAESRRNNAKGKRKPIKKTPKAYAQHMEDENENENENRNAIKNGKENEIEDEFFKSPDVTFSKALALYKSCTKLTTAKEEWELMTPEERDTALIQIPQVRKIYEDDNKLKFLWDFSKYLHEKMYKTDIDNFKTKEYKEPENGKDWSTNLRNLGKLSFTD